MNEKYILKSDVKRIAFLILLAIFIYLLIFSLSGETNFILLMLSIGGLILFGFYFSKADNEYKKDLMYQKTEKKSALANDLAVYFGYYSLDDLLIRNEYCDKSALSLLDIEEKIKAFNDIFKTSSLDELCRHIENGWGIERNDVYKD